MVNLRSPSQLAKKAKADKKKATKTGGEAMDQLDELSEEFFTVQSEARKEVNKLTQAAKAADKHLNGDPAGKLTQTGNIMAKALRDAAEIARLASERLLELAHDSAEVADTAERANKAMVRAKASAKAAEAQAQLAMDEAIEAKAVRVMKAEEVKRRAYPVTINVPKEKKTVQAAIDACQDGDRVIISSGRYHEQLKVNKSIDIKGGGPRSAIVIEWNGKGHALQVSGGVKARLSNLTIRQTGSGKTSDCIHIDGGDVEVDLLLTEPIISPRENDLT